MAAFLRERRIPWRVRALFAEKGFVLNVCRQLRRPEHIGNYIQRKVFSVIVFANDESRNGINSAFKINFASHYMLGHVPCASTYTLSRIDYAFKPRLGTEMRSTIVWRDHWKSFDPTWINSFSQDGYPGIHMSSFFTFINSFLKFPYYKNVIAMFFFLFNWVYFLLKGSTVCSYHFQSR